MPPDQERHDRQRQAKQPGHYSDHLCVDALRIDQRRCDDDFGEPIADRKRDDDRSKRNHGMDEEAQNVERSATDYQVVAPEITEDEGHQQCGDRKDER